MLYLKVMNVGFNVSNNIVYEAMRIVNNNHLMIYAYRIGRTRIRGAFKSTSTPSIYFAEVDLSTGKYYCTCPYYLIRGKPCKHIIALLFTWKRYVKEYD